LLKPFRFRLLRIFAQSSAECCMKLVEPIVKPFKLNEIAIDAIWMLIASMLVFFKKSPVCIGGVRVYAARKAR
jgi:hypothetical protein